MKYLRLKLPVFLLILAVSLVAASSAYGQATIEILNNDLSGVGFNDLTPVAPVGGNGGTTLGQQRLNAFKFAADIWGATLSSGPKIIIRASWEPMSCTADRGTLGSAGTVGLRQNFPNAPFTNTWYSAAQANALSGSDANPLSPEISARFNINLGTPGCMQPSKWYLGLDGNHGFGGVDLVAVLLHEFGHGLGFQNFTNPETGNFASGVPSVWDRFLRDNTTGKLWIQMTATERMASATNNGNLVWAGPNVSAAVPAVLFGGADSSNRPLMYAPSAFEPGSSVSHFDKSASPSLLMEPNITSGLSHTLNPPDDLTFPLLRDLGWQPAGAGPAPTPSPPPNNNFSAAQAISGCSGTVNGSNSGATRESGEPNHADANGNRSVWYRWQAPATGTVTINTNGSAFDTVLGVYRGTAVGSLTLVGANDDVTLGAVRTSALTFPATAGFIYRIAVDGFNGGDGTEVGPITLNWNQSQCSSSWTPATPPVVDLKTWKFENRTSVYVKLTFPDTSYRVASWGTPTRSGNDFSANASVERRSGAATPVTNNTAQIYDLGALAAGNYTFNFRNFNSLVKTLSFTVSSTAPSPNPIDDARRFVQQQYLDFLRREPDGPGWDHWTGEITQCSNAANRQAGETEAQCVERKRANTSAAFFLSPECQNGAYFVLRVYLGALGRMPHFGGANTAADEFTRDSATVAQGVVVNNKLAPAVINANKQAFVNQFVTRSEFRAIYDGLSNTQYVDRLFQTTGVSPSSTDRQALINGLGNGSETRASVLFKVVDGTNTITDGHLEFKTVYGKAFYDNKFNEAFVQMEYFSYLLRDPDDGGYNFWLSKLDTFGNWLDAQMVLAFIKSPEYRARFGQP